MKLGNRALLALFVVLALALSACGDDDGDNGAVVDEGLGLIEDGKLRVGSDINFAPFEFVEDGVEKGFDIELMDEIAKRLGVEAEYVNTSFDTIFTQLAGGEFDVIISAITITDERDETIDFSSPYFAANQALVVPKDSDITGVADLDGKDVGTQAGTTGLDYAKENFTGARVVEFPDAPAGFTAMAAGQLDAMFIDLPVAAEQVEGNADFMLAEEVDTNELYGIGLQEGNSALQEAINTHIADMITDGTYAAIYAKWFEGDVPQQFRAAADDTSETDS